MEAIHFSDELLTGDEGIDNEHRLIFFLVNNMQGSVYGGSLEVGLRTYVNILKTHATNHFAHEEEFMALHKYTEMEEHLKEHEGFVNTIKAVEEKMAVGALTFEEIQTMVAEWLNTHIRDMDLKMVLAVRGTASRKPA